MWLDEDGHARGSESPAEVLSHAGLGYTKCAPLAVLREDPEARGRWLHGLTRCPEPRHYAQAYHRWSASFQGPDTLCFTVRAESRVLIGHGTSSATGVGLTLHHTWGVPVLPGSALKGLTAQYVQTVYGPDGTGAPEREPFQGPVWERSRLVQSPGAVFQRLFGAPDLEEFDARGGRGEVLFHDALWIPSQQGPMLARDVLTVHQRAYYESGGTLGPVDYDDPIPVPFLTVAPGQRFLVVLEAKGAPELLERAARYLCEALESWGVGGKTVAGYGRLVREASESKTPVPAPSPAPVRRPLETPVLKEWKAWLEEQKTRGVPQRQQFQQVEQHWTERLLALTPSERQGAAQLLKKYLKLKRPEEQTRMNALLERLCA